MSDNRSDIVERRPKVSVSLITYNHEKYIAEAIESALRQRTDFPFEIVVGDDGSSDATREILDSYAQRFPDIIRLKYRDPNLGMVRNAIQTISECAGEYIALLEGDDYWVDDDKLQVQHDFLEKNPDCSMCYTNGASFVDGEDRSKIAIDNPPPEKFTLSYFLLNNVTLQNNTKMFRKSAHPARFPDWYFEIIQWDWVLHVYHAKCGSIGYIDRMTFMHRRHPGSVLVGGNKKEILLSAITANSRMNEELDFQFDSVLSDKSWYYQELLVLAFKQRDLFEIVKYLVFVFVSKPTRSLSEYRDILWRIRN